MSQTPFTDGPASDRFTPIELPDGQPVGQIDFPDMSNHLQEVRSTAFTGPCVFWGVPFHLGRTMVVAESEQTIEVTAARAGVLAFLHAVDDSPDPTLKGLSSILERQTHLGDHLADYIVCYEDGSEEVITIRRRHEVGSIKYEPCMAAVPHRKSVPVLPNGERPDSAYGWHETRATKHRVDPWMNYLYGWENPEPDKTIVAIRLVPHHGVTLLSGVSLGEVASNPFLWRERRKCVLTLPEGTSFDGGIDEHGLMAEIQLDMGQIITVRPRLEYANSEWAHLPIFSTPVPAPDEYSVEYTSHEDAVFTLLGGRRVTVGQVEGRTGPENEGTKEEGIATAIRVVSPAHRHVKVRVIDAETRKPMAAKLHIHGVESEYLPPTHRQRVPNSGFFEDYGADHAHEGTHFSTYVDGTFDVRLPDGPLFVEASRGFEYRATRTVVHETKSDLIEIPLRRELNWRKRGWITADTHVHFLSPSTALYEGQAEGVNVVNLLASQWGEMMSNVGDFDGETTLRTPGNPGSDDRDDYFVRVGTENRQHILGHISLLGYSGEMITPLCSGGPDESAHGDPVEILLTEWAKRCREQNGLVIMPHIPIFSLESTAALVEGLIDAVEMVSWGNMHGGLNPYSLAQWYEFLNCGYRIPAVGGTDKMTQSTAVGTVRTYAMISEDRAMDYDVWMEAIRSGDTFVTYGPLVDIEVEGTRPGKTLRMPTGGGVLHVKWEASSVSVRMSSIDLIVNGRTVETVTPDAESVSGEWTIKVNESSWIACLVRGSRPGKPDVVAAHSSAVFVDVDDSRLYNTDDALSILSRIQGSLVFLETTGTRANPTAYQRMRLILESSARKVHNMMHQKGIYHDHSSR